MTGKLYHIYRDMKNIFSSPPSRLRPLARIALGSPSGKRSEGGQSAVGENIFLLTLLAETLLITAFAVGFHFRYNTLRALLKKTAPRAFGGRHLFYLIITLTMSKIRAEYIWIDGQKPTAKLRSKTKIIDGPVSHLGDIPDWGFDGSSTSQAVTQKSDCMLRPVYFIPDVLRGGQDILALCEVLNPDGSVHETNTRAHLRVAAEKHRDQEPWFGIEQEYTLFDGIKPLGWPDNGFPAPQGGYYCGVGSDEVFGRELIERHTSACMEAGLAIYGTNAEVMPAQWEFQIGTLGALEAADQLWLARWLLYRIGENLGISAKLHPKPIKGDWNGAGAHTNFSTKVMRAPGGITAVREACEKLARFHSEHIGVYGAHNEERLTGRHETCPITEFRYGVSDRGASVRIPMATDKMGSGYLEDRRPAANMDPYQVCTALIETVCGDGFQPRHPVQTVIPKFVPAFSPATA